MFALSFQTLTPQLLSLRLLKVSYLRARESRKPSTGKTMITLHSHRLPILPHAIIPYPHPLRMRTKQHQLSAHAQHRGRLLPPSSSQCLLLCLHSNHRRPHHPQTHVWFGLALMLPIPSQSTLCQKPSMSSCCPLMHHARMGFYSRQLYLSPHLF